MGLFQKKEISEDIQVMFYEGLRGFHCNFPCHILFVDGMFRITTMFPQIEVTLDSRRISSIDIFEEMEYMSKYKGTSIETSKMKAVQKSYFVINYVSKEGEDKQLVFWGTASEVSKVRKLREEFVKNKPPESYEI